MIMEYFNTYTSGYINAINKFHNAYKVRLEPLGDNENVVGEITKDLSVTAQGQININYEPIVRRSCSISMINVDKKYIPSPNNTFWFGRKFKLWIGVVDYDTGNIYWWAQGVFYTQSANSDGNVVNIEGIDKGGALNGALGMSLTDAQYIIPIGTNYYDVVRDTLMLNTYGVASKVPSGSSKVIDPVMPIIDRKYRNIKTESKLSIDAYNNIGDLFQSLAEGYNADMYYDINGHFQVCELTDGSRVDGYKYMASQWDYDYRNAFYGLSNFEYNFDSRNVVTVYTNASDLENVSYTAYNRNPTSPLRVGIAGVRRMEGQEIKYVDVTKEQMLKKCKDYAEYLLIKESMRGMNVTFDSPIIPHLDVNRTITITDKLQELDHETFIIQSISIPLTATTMSISATSINWLPNQFEIEGWG
jgi:hypothetical protein